MFVHVTHFDHSLEVCKTLIEQGVDILELGVPFSDPLADGLTNQLAAQRALEAGCTQEDVFQLVREIRKFSEIPIVFYTYYNLIFSQGVRSMQKVKRCRSGWFTDLDLPPEEADELIEACKSLTLPIFLLSLQQPRKKGSPKLQRMRPDFYYALAKV